MDKKTKLWLIVAASCVLVGCIVFTGVMTVLKWDFKRLSTVDYETREYKISETYQNISVVTDTAKVVFIPTDDAVTSVICREQEHETHSVSVIDDTLTIKLLEEKKWYKHIGISFETPEISVYIPKGAYGNLAVKVSTGDVALAKDISFANIDITASTGDVKNLASASGAVKINTTTGGIDVEKASAGSMKLTVSTGKITLADVTCEGDIQADVTTGKSSLTNVKCKNLNANGTTGDITLQNVVAVETFLITRNTGDVYFNNSDAAEITVKTSTGDVEGTLLTEKIFFARSDTGKVDVPKSTSGGKCEITTDTGKIVIKIA